MIQRVSVVSIKRRGMFKILLQIWVRSIVIINPFFITAVKIEFQINKFFVNVSLLFTIIKVQL